MQDNPHIKIKYLHVHACTHTHTYEEKQQKKKYRKEWKDVRQYDLSYQC